MNLSSPHVEAEEMQIIFHFQKGLFPSTMFKNPPTSMMQDFSFFVKEDHTSAFHLSLPGRH